MDNEHQYRTVRNSPYPRYKQFEAPSANTRTKSWTLRPEALSDRELARFDENRSNGDFPPLSVAQLGLDRAKKKYHRKRKLSMDAPPIVEERSSCLVISGDQQGYLWNCSVWSSVTDAEGVAEQPIKAAEKVLHHFINRQGSARCLVFLVFLGHLCEQVAFHYDEVLGRLDDILGLGVSPTFVRRPSRP